MFMCWVAQITRGGNEGALTESPHPDWEGQGGLLGGRESEARPEG